MKVGYLITARLKSTRLPRKILLEVGGKPFLSHMIHRIRKAALVDEIVICTSTNPQDDPLEELAAVNGVGCFRGDEEDVILRLHEAIVNHEFDYVLSATADCPLVDPRYSDKIVRTFKTVRADLTRAMELPLGVFCYGLRPAAIARVVEIKDDIHTEVWGRYFTDTGMFRVHDLDIEKRHRWPDLRMTLDYPEDYEFFKALWAGMTVPPQDATLDEILDFLRHHPEIVQVNSSCSSDWQRRIEKQGEIHLKPKGRKVPFDNE